MSAIAVVTVPAVTLCVTEEKQWAESYGQQNAMGPGVYATEQQATGETMHAMQTQPQLPPQPLVCKWCSHRQYVCLSKVAVIKL